MTLDELKERYAAIGYRIEEAPLPVNSEGGPTYPGYRIHEPPGPVPANAWQAGIQAHQGPPAGPTVWQAGTLHACEWFLRELERRRAN